MRYRRWKSCGSSAAQWRFAVRSTRRRWPSPGRIGDQRDQEQDRRIGTDLPPDAAKDLNQKRTDLSKITASSIAIDDRVSRTTVTSPVHGVIKQLKVNTIGGVVQPGSDMVEIVPLEDNLLIEAKVRPQDVAFLHPGQKAMVKFSAYDYTIYGGLSAKLELIGADTITDDKGNSFYLIQVRTDKNHLGGDAKPLLIIPGMVATVDIITGEKSVLDYLLKPVLKARTEAMRER